MENNDGLIIAATEYMDFTLIALDKLRENYRATNEAAGDDDDPNRVTALIVTCEAIKSEIESLVP